MKLRRRQKRKTKQALDAVASVSKLWSEMQLGKRAAKGVEKAKELRPPSKLKRALSLKWVKIGGAVAVVGGAGAAVARKLKGSGPEDYTGPPPSVAAEAAVPSPDTPPPLSVAPDPATQERDTEPASGPTALRANRDAAAAAAAAQDTGDTPEAVSDAADEAPDEPPAPASDATDDVPEPAADADAPEPAADAAEAADDAPKPAVDSDDETTDAEAGATAGSDEG